MVFACYRDFLKDFKDKKLASAPNKLFEEGGPAWRAYKKEHAAEIAKLPKSACSSSQSRKKGKKVKNGTFKKIRGSRRIMKMLLHEGNFDDDAKAEIKRLLA